MKFPERLSVASSAAEIVTNNETMDKYKNADEIEGGALREGGAPNLYTKQLIGLQFQYICIGWVYGAFPRTIYPFF